MGRYSFFKNYLVNCSNADVDVLKEMQNMGDDDDKLLVPALFYLGTEWGKRARRENYASLTRGNVIRMLELNLLLRKLPRGHNYNIFEYFFLAIGDLGIEGEVGPLCWAIFSFVAQIVLLVILMYHYLKDIPNVTSWSTDVFTILVAIITTVFFAKLVYVHGREAYNFNTVFWRAGFLSIFIKKVNIQLRNGLLIFNILFNVGYGIVVVLFNIFVLLISKKINEAILNSLSLFFFLEINDNLKPDWGEMNFDRRIAFNLIHYIAWDDGGGVDVHDDMVLSPASGDGGGGVQVDIKSPSALEENSWDGGGDVQVNLIGPWLEEDYMPLLESDDKVRLKTTDDTDQLAVTVSWKRRRIGYEKLQFHISGANGRYLFNDIKEFRCVNRDVSFSLTYWNLQNRMNRFAVNQENIARKAAKIHREHADVIRNIK